MKNKKYWNLERLTNDNGIFIAYMRHKEHFFERKIKFMFYSKWEVIRELRNSYSCSVSHEYY